MNIHLRRTLASLFFLFFLLGFLPLIFITSGTLYNTKKKSFEKTSLLILESEPRGARILLNGKNPENWWSFYLPAAKNKISKTPKRLNYLLPSRYEIKVSSEGYYDWNYSTELHGGDSTIIDSIKLWPTTPPEKLLPSQASHIKISPSFKKIAYLNSNNEIIVFDSEKNAVIHTLPQKELLTDIVWGSLENNIYIQKNNTFELYNLITNTIERVSFSAAVDHVRWDETSGKLYGLTTDQNVISEQYDAPSKELYEFKNIADLSLNDSDIFDGAIWGITSDAVYRYSESGDIQKTPFDFEPQNLDKIILHDTTWIYISTKDGSLYRMHKPSSGWQTLNLKNIKGLSITTIDNTALWWNEFEIGTIKLDTNETITHTRLSSPIITVIIDKTYDNNHHLAIVNNRVVVLESVLGSTFRTQELFTLPYISEAYFDNKTNTLFLQTVDESFNEQVWTYSTIKE